MIISILGLFSGLQKYISYTYTSRITSRIWKLIPLRRNTIMLSRKVDISSTRKLWVTLMMAGIRL